MDCFPGQQHQLGGAVGQEFSLCGGYCGLRQTDGPAGPDDPAFRHQRSARAMPRLVTDRSKEVYPWSSSMSQ